MEILARRIVLLPIEPVDPTPIAWLVPELAAIMRLPVETLEAVSIPEEAYMPSRGQYSSTRILEAARSLSRPQASKLLGITTPDLYSKGLNFVFGEAYVGGDTAVISLHRLYPEFHGQHPDEALLRQRMLKEAVHELGHTLGFGHCPNPRCVMHFSNSIEDTDLKGPGFCSHCQTQLTNQPLKAIY